MKNNKITLLIFLMLFSLSISSQVSKKQVTKTTTTVATQNNSARQQSQPNLYEVLIEPGMFWSENFGSPVSITTGDKGNTALNFGWTKTELSNNGSKPNQWFVSATAPGVDATGSCSENWPLSASANLYNRSLHVGKFGSVQDGDEGAFYQATEENITDVRIESPVINCVGMSDLSISFDYYAGGDGQTIGLEFYCYDGQSWVLVTTFLPTDICGLDEENMENRTTKWTKIEGLVLPESANDQSTVKIGFRWKNLTPLTSNSNLVSAAIDNIKLYNKGVAATNTVTYASEERSVKTNTVITERKVEFTVYPNPNSGQFTIDFAGIENNHEVQIVLSDLQTGKQLYTTTFFSSTIEHNKIDVNPTEKIKPGRYSCSLICEGIKITKQVIIN